MTNDEVFVEIQNLSKHINKLHKEKNWEERNKLTPIYRRLVKSYVFPFTVGQEVLFNNKPHVIQEHLKDDNRFVVKNTNGTPTVVCGTMLSEIIDAEIQLNLF